MDFHHRKLLRGPDKIPDKDYDPCYMCYGACPDECSQYLLPPPLPTPSNSNHEMSTILILMLCVLGAVFLVLVYLTVRKYRNSRRTRDSSSAPLDRGDGNLRQDFLDEHQGPVVDHPIWYIRTVGLPQTVIDSIAMFKYKKGGGLMEGSDCSVCLSEFEENEVLRLLPKCSHSFHVPCIDTWLRSHTNCPVCRAPVVVSKTNASAVDNVDSETREENRVENEVSEADDGGEDSRNGNSSSATMIDEDKVAEILSKNVCNLNARNGGLRVLSDLAEHRSKMDRELRSVRRAVSMDFGSSSVTCQRMVNLNAEKGEGYPGPVVEIVHEKQSWDKIGRGRSRNDSICRLIKSYSYGRSMQKRSILMKRSFSFSGKRSLRKQSRSQESIVPGPTERREGGR